jgi:hypothetical protein
MKAQPSGCGARPPTGRLEKADEEQTNDELLHTNGIGGDIVTLPAGSFPLQFDVESRITIEDHVSPTTILEIVVAHRDRQSCRPDSLEAVNALPVGIHAGVGLLTAQLAIHPGSLDRHPRAVYDLEYHARKSDVRGKDARRPGWRPGHARRERRRR